MLMKHFVTIAILVLFSLTSFYGGVFAQQQTVHAKNGLNATPRNYTWFTSPYKDVNPEAIQNNQGFEHHPELGMLFAETPCDNCYELMGHRSEISKTFIKAGTGGKDILRQTSSAPMHYKDADGNWRTIKTR